MHELGPVGEDVFDLWNYSACVRVVRFRLDLFAHVPQNCLQKQSTPCVNV